MKDTFGRTIDYMRISITDRCNLRCTYCMPDGVKMLPMEDLLTYEEIVQVASAAAELGITHYRITGGEPLLRRGCPTLISMIKAVPQVESVTMTTNGILLKSFLPELLAAGLDSVNISLDTTDRDTYAALTGRDELEAVLQSIQEAVDAGLPVKLNAVLLKGINDNTFKSLLAIPEKMPVNLRFIELMPIGHGADHAGVPGLWIRDQIEESYGPMTRDETWHGNGPAVYYRIPGFAGSIGFIDAVGDKFCGTCNRIRLTSTGEVKSCLCYENSVDLRPVLRSGDTKEETGKKVRELLTCAIKEKPKMHCFEDKEGVTETREMGKIGG